tara:strand:+ start:43 stop:792 length:750 start_codon:yes stop_codon:yes gene_type:complete
MEYFFNVNTGRVEQRPIVQNNNLPFNVGERLFNEFNNASAVPNITTFDPKSLQSIFPTNVQTGITASSAAAPFGTSVDNIQGFTDKEDFSRPEEKTGIAKLFEFLQKFSPSGLAVKGLNALGSVLDFSDSPNYRPATVGVFGYTPEELNKMNALGGFYSEPMREMRRRSNRISNIMRRAAEGKSFSQKNLDNLMNQFNMGNVDTGAMIQSIKESADMGYGKGGGGIFDSGRDYSSSPGAIAGDMEYGEE